MIFWSSRAICAKLPAAQEVQHLPAFLMQQHPEPEDLASPARTKKPLIGSGTPDLPGGIARKIVDMPRTSLLGGLQVVV
jgi:hypothetical protein